jgi:hypothetical protein
MRSTEFVNENFEMPSPEKILQDQDAHNAVELCIKRKRRWPAAEEFIATSAEHGYGWDAYRYALMVVRDRWPEAEPYIMQNGHQALEYALRVMHERWSEAEPEILADFNRSTYYYEQDIDAMADYVSMCRDERWPEYEQMIIDKSLDEFVFSYLNIVVQGPWPQAEHVLAQFLDMWVVYCEGYLHITDKNKIAELRAAAKA